MLNANAGSDSDEEEEEDVDSGEKMRPLTTILKRTSLTEMNRLLPTPLQTPSAVSIDIAALSQRMDSLDTRLQNIESMLTTLLMRLADPSAPSAHQAYTLDPAGYAEEDD